MTVKVEWETGVGGSKGFPGFANTDKFLEWEKKSKLKTGNIARQYLFPIIPDKKPAE